jgi:hypothetical protein
VLRRTLVPKLEVVAVTRWLVEPLHSVPFRQWVMADGPSQAAANWGDMSGSAGESTVVVHAENGESFTFKVKTAIGQATSVRWVRDWSDLGDRSAD